MMIGTTKTGHTKVSSAVPDRSTHKWDLAYTGLFQRRSSRITIPVKCYYVKIGAHHILIDTGWAKAAVKHPLLHLGPGLYFASEPVIKEEETAFEQQGNLPVDLILLTHLDCDHVSGLQDFPYVKAVVSKEEYAYARKNMIRYGYLFLKHKYTFLEFNRDQGAPFGLSADVFGDGSLTAYLAPGHSAGSVIYKVKDDQHFALFVGDNGYMAASWENCVLPGPLYSKENMRDCLDWINEQSKKENCVGIFCGHDPIDR